MSSSGGGGLLDPPLDSSSSSQLFTDLHDEPSKYLMNSDKVRFK